MEVAKKEQGTSCLPLAATCPDPAFAISDLART